MNEQTDKTTLAPIQFKVAPGVDQTPGQTLRAFWAQSADDLCVALGDRDCLIEVCCGNVCYPPFNPREFLETNAAYQGTLGCIAITSIERWDLPGNPA